MKKTPDESMLELPMSKMHSLIQELKVILKKQRKYASHFDYPDKHIKEKGMIINLFSSMEKEGGCPYSNLRSSVKDPPDCIAEDEKGNTVGFEVTELVCQSAVKLNEKGKQVYRLWNPDEVVSELKKIISEKDRKSFHGGPYSNLILVIHTDESEITAKDYHTHLRDIEFPETSQINEVYLLFSYNPKTKSHPYIKLNVES